MMWIRKWCFCLPAWAGFLLSWLCTGGSVALAEKMVANTYIRLDSAQASSFFPSIGHGGHREFSPDKALSRGSGYWCSEGNHRKDEVVSWTGQLKTRRLVEGIEIHWAYAPGKVSISGSFDGAEPFQEVMAFQDVNSAGPQFHQVLTFPHPVHLKAIRILMKDPQSQYLGISLVQLLGGGFPILRIQSGITSPHQDLCLQSDERGDIVLEGCLTSIAAADERALWQFTEQGQLKNPVLNVCMFLRDNVAQDGGQVVAGDCGAAYAAQDGRSVWELQPNNQLELLRGGNYCLSQMGSKAGSSDVAKNSEVRSSHSRSADNDHAPSSAVDGKESTFWASQEFQKAAVPEAVLFDVDFGDKYKLRTTDIDWEFPPLSYSIATSLDGVNYAEVSRNDVNTSYTTLDDMKAVIAQYLRIRLQRPHPTMGVSNDMLVYGIKTLSVYSNRLRSIVEPCSKAKASADARDKFFLELVTEVDLSAGIELRRAGEIAASASASMAKSLSAVAEVSEPIKTCFEGKEAATLKLAALDAEVVDALGYLSVFEEGLTSSSESVAGATASSTMRGLSQEHPVEDCYTLKTLYNKATSGFYWVLPLCASQPLRAYCDISSGGTYATVPDNDSIVSLRDAVKACAKIGLEPIHLRTNRQLPALQRMLDIMEIDLTNPVPVAVNNGASVFYSLDFKKDVTEFIVPAQQGGALIGNTVGISPSGLIFFDSSETDMSTIICSTNKDAWNPPQSYIDVTCITAVGGNAAFDGPPGTTFFVRCPEGCIHYVDEAKVVGGEEGVYAEDSSICIAAIHAGLLSRGGDVSIRISPTPAEFEGTDKNGILSSSFFGHTDKRAFVVETVALQCPMDRSHSSSFLELGFSHSAKPPRDSGWPKLISVPAKTMQQLNAAPSQALSAASAAQSSAVIEEMNELTVMAINQLSTILSQQLGGLNMEVVEHIRLTATKAVSGSRSKLKPTEATETRLQLESKETIKQVEHLVMHLKLFSGKLAQALETSTKEVNMALQRRAEQSATDEWSLDAVKNAELADMFHIFDSRLTVGSSRWTLGTPRIGKRGGHQSLCQSSAVTPTVPGSSGTGTYSIVKNKAFYDFVLAADIYISGSGSVGVAFRVKDRKNMFLFEMKQQGNGGSKRLLRIVNGVPTETAKLEDGGYVEGIWYHVEVHGQLQRISVRVSEISENAPAAASKFDIDLLDGSFMSGSIGFYTSAVNSACFDKVAVTPLPCTGSKEKALLPPYPPRCSNYRESFVGRLSEEWEPSDPALADVPSHWKYAADVGGERITIAQMSATGGGTDDKAPAILALGRHRSCEEGLFSFKFFPQCEGVVGAIFNVQDHDNFMLFEMGPSFARLRTKIRGVFSTLTKSALWAFKPGTWNTIKVFFNRSHVVIKAGNSTALPVFSVGRSDELRSGTVGLTTWRCAGVAFASISLHPPDEKALTEVIPAQDLPAFEQISRPKLGLHNCIGADSLPARVHHCSANGSSSPGPAPSGFCEGCCTREFTNSEKARSSCTKHCAEAFEAEALVCEELGKMRETCTGTAARALYSSCSGDGHPDNCTNDVCKMCCATYKTPMGTIPAFWSPLVKECQSACNTRRSRFAQILV